MKISIITACYNSENNLEQTILSVLGQSYAPIEYIIVDGGSTDGTMQIVDKYRDRISFVISEKDEGIYDAFNKGIRVSTGDIIAFLNSDDYLYDSESIAKVVRGFRSAGDNTQAVYGNIIRINEANGYTDTLGRQTSLDDLKKGNMPPHPALFVKKNVFEREQCFDLGYRIGSDLDFVIKLFKADEDRCRYINETITVFRIGGASSNLSNRLKVRSEKNEILQRHFSDAAIVEYKPQELNMHFYKKWIEVLLFRQHPVSSSLWHRGVRHVALFGSTEMALYVCKDLQESGIQVHAFLDNDTRRHGHKMLDIPIRPTEWLADGPTPLDAIVFAFEGDHDSVIQEQIKRIIPNRNVPCYSWKQLVVWGLENVADK